MKLHKILRFGLLGLIVAFLLLGTFPGCANLFSGPPHEAPALRADAGKLHATVVSAHLDVPLDEKTNVIWCGTFQLAWNELCDLDGGPVRLRGDMREAAILNRKVFTKDDLDAASYIAVAGRLGGGVRHRIESRVAKFPPAARPELDPGMFVGPPTDVLIYSYLFKQLKFPKPFEALTDPLDFAQKKVVCFGMEGGKPGDDKIAAQISILDYRNRDDFIVELKTDSDHLVLAKLPLKLDSAHADGASGLKMSDLISSVRRRMAATQPVAAYAYDVLRVPKMNFDVNQRYVELAGRMLTSAGPSLTLANQIEAADQEIKFVMDEKGVILKSESHISLTCAAEGPPPPRHMMIFDKPFLIMMTHNQASVPYFACWVANPEILVGVKQ